jgi:hypothetical protein
MTHPARAQGKPDASRGDAIRFLSRQRNGPEDSGSRICVRRFDELLHRVGRQNGIAVEEQHEIGAGRESSTDAEVAATGESTIPARIQHLGLREFGPQPLQRSVL